MQLGRPQVVVAWMGEPLMSAAMSAVRGVAPREPEALAVSRPTLRPVVPTDRPDDLSAQIAVVESVSLDRQRAIVDRSTRFDVALGYVVLAALFAVLGAALGAPDRP